MMNKITELIKKAKTIAILPHTSEDADAVGSSYALKLALLGMGKDVECYFSGEPEEHIEFLGKNYKLLGDNTQAVDLAIAIDTADIERLGNRKAIFESAQNTALIDHHATNKGFADANFIDSKSPATGEIIYELLTRMDVKLTREIAVNLYAAISGDTGSFKYSNVRPRTLEITAELLKYDINHAEIARKMYDNEPLASVKFKGYLMQNIEGYCNGMLNIVAVDNKTFEKFGVLEKNSGDIVNIPRAVRGCEIAVSIRETAEKIKISFRSQGKFDVSLLAQKFGGGGHKMAAGASQTEKGLEEVKLEIIKVCEEVLNG